MTAHLGYEKGNAATQGNQRNGFSEKTIKTQQGEQRIKVPRDRKATFDPVIVPKHQSISQELEDCIQLLYAKGMSNSDIIDFIESTYGVEYSTSQVSIITNQLAGRYPGVAEQAVRGPISHHLDRCHPL